MVLKDDDRLTGKEANARFKTCTVAETMDRFTDPIDRIPCDHLSINRSIKNLPKMKGRYSSNMEMPFNPGRGPMSKELKRRHSEKHAPRPPKEHKKTNKDKREE